MFTALNRFISRLDGDAPAKQDSPGAFGFQVLRNSNLQLAVEPWFDFVVGINGRMIDDTDPRLFAQEVRNCAGGTVMLGLWSAKGQRTRAMHVPVPVDTASLGLTLQWTPLSVASNIWHVLDVPSGSPADAAGLLPYSDYILGTPEGVLHGEGGLGELVEDHMGQPLRLYVYNNEYDVTRELTIRPSRDWGGEGALGCVLGYGALHRLPAPLSEPVHAPGETLFDGGEVFDETGGNPSQGYHYSQQQQQQESPSGPFMSGAAGDTNFVSAADMLSGGTTPTVAGGAPPPGPASSPGVGPPPAGGTGAGSGIPVRGKKKDRHGAKPIAMMDDYFKEQEDKSRQLDGAPSGRSGSPLPPPPPPPPKKAPPKAGDVATSPPPPLAEALETAGAEEEGASAE